MSEKKEKKAFWQKPQVMKHAYDATTLEDKDGPKEVHIKGAKRTKEGGDYICKWCYEDTKRVIKVHPKAPEGSLFITPHFAHENGKGCSRHKPKKEQKGLKQNQREPNLFRVDTNEVGCLIAELYRNQYQNPWNETEDGKEYLTAFYGKIRACRICADGKIEKIEHRIIGECPECERVH